MINILFYTNVCISFILTLAILLTTNMFIALIIFFILMLNITLTYIIIGSSFIATTYLIMYLSLILILVITNVMYSSDIIKTINIRLTENNILKKRFALIISVFFFFIGSFVNNFIIHSKIKYTNNNFNDIKLETIGINLMTTYIIPFETISLILLASLIGIIIKLK